MDEEMSDADKLREVRRWLDDTKGRYSVETSYLRRMCHLAERYLARPEDGGITQALVEMARENAIEECADLADQNLDHYSGTECTYRGDVAEKIRALKRREPQNDPPNG